MGATHRTDFIDCYVAWGSVFDGLHPSYALPLLQRAPEGIKGQG